MSELRRNPDEAVPPFRRYFNPQVGLLARSRAEGDRATGDKDHSRLSDRRGCLRACSATALRPREIAAAKPGRQSQSQLLHSIVRARPGRWVGLRLNQVAKALRQGILLRLLLVSGDIQDDRDQPLEGLDQDSTLALQ
jgi:hypothetical protein